MIVTDRNDLDGQMFETFAACPDQLRTEPRQAQEVDDLKDMLRNQEAGGVFFTTIQKFKPDNPGKPMEVLCDRSNVIVICDEAHRTQYGFKARFDRKTGQMKYGLAKHMREALPNAVYLGLTGTPISQDDKDTQAVFGEYVDIYDVLSSQRDGTTVPIHYESRIIDLAVNAEELEDLDEDLDELLESEDEVEKNQAVSRLARLESIAMADGRLERLASDLVAHWDSRLEVMDGKAMIVAMSRPAAVALYDEIIKVRPEWHSDDLGKGVIKVVMYSPTSDLPKVRRHATTPGQKKQLERRLKNPADPMRARDRPGHVADRLRCAVPAHPLRGQAHARGGPDAGRGSRQSGLEGQAGWTGGGLHRSRRGTEEGHRPVHPDSGGEARASGGVRRRSSQAVEGRTGCRARPVPRAGPRRHRRSAHVALGPAPQGDGPHPEGRSRRRSGPESGAFADSWISSPR